MAPYSDKFQRLKWLGKGINRLITIKTSRTSSNLSQNAHSVLHYRINQFTER